MSATQATDIDLRIREAALRLALYAGKLPPTHDDAERTVIARARAFEIYLRGDQG